MVPVRLFFCAFQLLSGLLDVLQLPFLGTHDLAVHGEKVQIQAHHTACSIVLGASQLSFDALQQRLGKCRWNVGFDDYQLVGEFLLAREIDGLRLDRCAVACLATKRFGELPLRPKKHLFCRRQIGAITYI